MANKERSLLRSLHLAEILAGHAFRGLRNGELAKALNVSAVTMSTDLKALEEAGWVERVPNMTDRWRLSPRGMRPWRTHYVAVERIKRDVGEIEQRFSREL